MNFNPIALAFALILPASADEAAKTKLMETGKATYAACASCHGMDGKGLQAGPSKMAPSLSKSDLVNGDPAVLSLIILRGIAKENQTYLGMMAPMAGVVADDEKLAGLLTYLRGSFENTSPMVTAEEAKKFREQWPEIKAPVTRAKIKELEDAAKKP